MTTNAKIISDDALAFLITQRLEAVFLRRRHG
jgi:hypothetical protein